MDEASVDGTSVNETSVVEASVNETSVDEASVNDASNGGPDSGDDAPPNDADPGADAESGDGSIGRDAASPDSSDDGSSDTNIAPLGTGFTWQSMTSSSANSGKLPAPAVNDNSLSTQVNIDSSTGDSANAWEAAGVIFSTGRAVSSVAFVQGTTGSTTVGDGWFEASFALQLSTDGATWSDSGWGANPAYAYSSAVSGKRYAFKGPQVTGIVGVRVIGQVNTVGKSWWVAVNEVMVMGH